MKEKFSGPSKKIVVNGVLMYRASGRARKYSLYYHNSACIREIFLSCCQSASAQTSHFRIGKQIYASI